MSDRGKSSHALFAIGIAGSLFAWCSISFAQIPDDPASISARLADVKKKIEVEQAQIEALQRRQAQIKAEVDNLNVDLKRATAAREEVQKHLDTLGSDINLIERAIPRIEQEIVDSRTALQVRTVAVYKMYRRTVALDYLFNAESVTNLLKRSRYLTDIAASDRARVKRLNGLIAEMSAEQLKLQERSGDRQQEVRRLEALQKEAEAKRAAKAKILEEANTERAKEEQALNELKQTAADLERVLATIMGGEQPKESTVVTKTDSAPVSFEGKGLASSRGRLPLPIKGEVVQRFGKRKLEEFSDVLFSKGFEMKGAPGDPVNAIAPGKVVFNQVLPTYGNVVILDHGSRYYSLYGRLASALCKVDDIVQAGDKIALVGEPDSKGRNFYFELRLEGKAIDPSGFFRERTKSKTGSPR